MTDEKNKPEKSKSFKSISELLNMDGGNDSGFDMEQAQKDLEKLEERKKVLTEYKNSIKEMALLDNDSYKLAILKQLVEKGLSMLEALQKEIEDSPRGRDVETAAAMMSAINGVIDNINKIDVSKEKIKIEQQKIELKQASGKDAGGNITQNNIYLTHSEFLDMIRNQETKDIKTVEVIKEE